MRTPSRTPLAAMTALVLLAAASACAPRPVHCPLQPDSAGRLDRNRGFTRENYAEVHPAMAATAVVATAAGLLAGHRCE